MSDLAPDEAARLIRQQASLQAEAQRVLDELVIMTRLRQLAPPMLIGSAAHGTMTWRDIDVSVICPGASLQHVGDVMAPYFRHPAITSARYINETGPFNPTGQPQDERFYYALYVARDATTIWKIDVSCWLGAGVEQREAEQTRIMQQLNDETRLAILWIKDIWCHLPIYRVAVLSIDIYDAVLMHGVRTPAQFDGYLSAHDKPTRADATANDHAI